MKQIIISIISILIIHTFGGAMSGLYSRMSHVMCPSHSCPDSCYDIVCGVQYPLGAAVSVQATLVPVQDCPRECPYCSWGGTTPPPNTLVVYRWARLSCWLYRSIGFTIGFHNHGEGPY